MEERDGQGLAYEAPIQTKGKQAENTTATKKNAAYSTLHYNYMNTSQQ